MRFVESLAITSRVSSQAPDERSEQLMSSLGFYLILSFSLPSKVGRRRALELFSL